MDDPKPKIAAAMPRTYKLNSGILILIGTLAAVALGLWIGRHVSFTSAQATAGWCFATFLFGLLVGLSEILSRYRDEPLRASATNYGLAYLVFNGLISLAAFAILRQYPDKIFPGIQSDLFLTSIIAGFGAMAVFRSKLFTFRSTDGKDYPIGPAIVLDTVLKTIDAKIDRRRATDRQSKVFDAMFNIHDFNNTANYIEASLPSFQNLSQEDKTQIKDVIDQYKKTADWPDTLKSLGLGFAFLTIAGEENFDQVLINLRQFVADQKQNSAGGSGQSSGSGQP